MVYILKAWGKHETYGKTQKIKLSILKQINIAKAYGKNKKKSTPKPNFLAKTIEKTKKQKKQIFQPQNQKTNKKQWEN